MIPVLLTANRTSSLLVSLQEPDRPLDGPWRTVGAFLVALEVGTGDSRPDRRGPLFGAPGNMSLSIASFMPTSEAAPSRRWDEKASLRGGVP